MDVNDQTYIDTIYYVANNDLDFMATTFRQGDGPWELEYRFRYYHKDADGNTDDPYDGQDKKSFYHGTMKDNTPESQKEAFDQLKVLTTVLADKLNATVNDIVEVKGGMSEMIAALGKRPWAHVKVASEPSTTIQ